MRLDKKIKVNYDKLEALKSTQGDLEYKSRIVKTVSLFFFTMIFKNAFSGKLVGKLPFQLYAFFRKFGIKDEENPSVFYLSFFPLYTLTSYMIRTMIKIYVLREREEKQT